MKSAFFHFSPVVLMFIIAGYATADLTDDLVVYFTFDNVKGNRIFDESGNGLDAKVIKNTKFVNGKYGNAVHITNDTEDCVNVPAVDELEISEEITMMAWMYHENWIRNSSQWFDKGCHSKIFESYGMAVLDKKDIPELINLENGSGLSMIVGGANWQQIDIIQNEMKNRTWHHVVGTYTDKAQKVYLDGEMIYEGTSRPDFSGTNDEDLRIGCAKGKPQYTFEGGSIDEVAIWSRALSQAEIRNAMRGPLFPVSPKDKVATTWGNIKRKTFQP